MDDQFDDRLVTILIVFGFCKKRNAITRNKNYKDFIVNDYASVQNKHFYYKCTDVSPESNLRIRFFKSTNYF